MINKKKPKKAAPKKQKRPKFEDCLPEIDIEISKKRSKWGLTALAWMDFQDVSQILRLHIFRKWHLYDPSKKLGPWVRTIISNQIKNLIRNNYTNFVKPCGRCAASDGATGCSIYEKQSADCPLYKNWLKNKKSAYETKMPLPLENHTSEVKCLFQRDFTDIEAIADKLHKRMKATLKQNEWSIYKFLYIEHKTELETAKLMGYKTSEKNRSPGYKQIKNVKKRIIEKVKKCLENNEIDIF